MYIHIHKLLVGFLVLANNSNTFLRLMYFENKIIGGRHMHIMNLVNRFVPTDSYMLVIMTTFYIHVVCL